VQPSRRPLTLRTDSGWRAAPSPPSPPAADDAPAAARGPGAPPRGLAGSRGCADAASDADSRPCAGARRAADGTLSLAKLSASLAGLRVTRRERDSVRALADASDV